MDIGAAGVGGQHIQVVRDVHCLQLEGLLVFAQIHDRLAKRLARGDIP